MSIKSICSECEAVMSDGVLKHRSTCSGADTKTSSSNPPKEVSNLKKDIENVFLQYRAELKQGLNELAGHGTPEEQSATQIINLIESVLPKEKTFVDDGATMWDIPDGLEGAKQRYEMTENAGYNQAIKDIKSKLIDGEKK